MPKVACSVANCEYWSPGNNCRADAIMIDIDQHANANYKEEFAGEPEHQDVAESVSHTCCHTFKKRTAK
ncbi:MAG TPA: DUF1540 domain-containing protein [Bacilli bacterium]